MISAAYSASGCATCSARASKAFGSREYRFKAPTTRSPAGRGKESTLLMSMASAPGANRAKRLSRSRMSILIILPRSMAARHGPWAVSYWTRSISTARRSLTALVVGSPSMIKVIPAASQFRTVRLAMAATLSSFACRVRSVLRSLSTRASLSTESSGRSCKCVLLARLGFEPR